MLLELETGLVDLEESLAQVRWEEIESSKAYIQTGPSNQRLSHLYNLNNILKYSLFIELIDIGNMTIDYSAKMNCCMVDISTTMPENITNVEG